MGAVLYSSFFSYLLFFLGYRFDGLLKILNGRFCFGLTEHRLEGYLDLLGRMSFEHVSQCLFSLG